MKKTILHLVQSDVTGGLENVYLDYCKILSEDFDLVCITSKGYVHLGELKKLGLKTEMLNIKGHFDLWAVIKLFFLVRKYSPELLIAHTGRVFSVVNWYHSIFGKSYFKNIAVNHGGNPKRLVKFDHIITVGSYLAANIKRKYKHISNDTVTTIHNGIKLNDKNNCKNKIKDTNFTFGTLSRVVPIKNIITAIKAFKLFLKDVPDAKLKIAGDGADLQKLQDFVKEQNLTNNIEFIGHTNDIEKFFNEIDVLIHPSISEGFSLTILEAFNYYTPVIASDIDNFKEIIRDKKNGFMYEDPINEINLYKVMSEFYSYNLQSKDKITAEARKDLEEKFSMQVTKQKLIDMVSSLVGERYN